MESLSKGTCFHMLVVYLIAIIANHKLVRVNHRLEWDTDYYKSEDFLLNPVGMLFSVHIIVQLYLCKCILAIQNAFAIVIS